MKHAYVLTFMCLAISGGLYAQTFTSQNGLLNDTYNSGGVVGAADMNNDGVDDIVIMDQSNNLVIEYGNLDGSLSFDRVEYGQVSGANQWGMCLGDLKNDGHKDVFSGGSFDGTHLVSIDDVDNSEMSDLPMGSLFMQACNMADINNDGWLDAFGCNDVAESRIWGNDLSGNLVPQNDWIDMATVPDSDNSGNYGSVWTDFDHDGDLDLFIAKCRQGVNDPNDPRRINALFVNDGNGNFTEQADDHGLVIYEQSWTADFADIDNDGDFDCFITNHTNTLTLLENDGSGNFTDITTGSGLEIGGFFLQAILKDFDNDGYVDLIYSGGTDAYFKNNGDNTFTEVPDMFPNDDTMHSFAVGDFDKDGFLDLYASYGNTYVNPDFNHEDKLWMNDGGSNNYIAFDLEGVISNMDAIGATVEIYGDWGVQIREVRSGESYGITNSFHLHFGVGTSTAVDSAVVSWPSGVQQTLYDLDVNQYHELVEIGCTNDVADLTVNGENFICPGETVEITAPDGAESYQWSNGETGQTIEVGEAGNYSATLYFDNECVGFTNVVDIEVIEEEVPNIEVEGDLTVCEGGSVLLTTASENVTWSTGELAQEVEVDQSGEYTVSREGICGELVSEPVTVLVIETPAASVIDDIFTDEGQTVTIENPVGNMTYWFDEETADVPVLEGVTYTTEPIMDDVTEIWYEEDVPFQGVPQFGGPETNEGPGAYHDNSSFHNTFDAYSDFTLKSVKVYANGEGNRVIQVIDDQGDVIEEGLFNIPDGESRVEVNFDIPQGQGYGLRCNTNNPQLFRNAIGTELNYPYNIGSACAITGTNIDGDNQLSYFYFFYDWEILPEVTCRSERGSLTIMITGVNEIDGLDEVSVYPNPASELLNIDFDLQSDARLKISLVDQLGQQVEMEDLEHFEIGKNNIQIPVGQLASGMYYLSFELNGMVATQKVVIQ